LLLLNFFFSLPCFHDLKNAPVERFGPHHLFSMRK
jgi:riboflavin transporter FmnP